MCPQKRRPAGWRPRPNPLIGFQNRHQDNKWLLFLNLVRSRSEFTLYVTLYVIMRNVDFTWASPGRFEKWAPSQIFWESLTVSWG